MIMGVASAAGPSTTNPAATTSRGAGRTRCASGPAIASTSGDPPTIVPTTAASACRSAVSRHTLNPTSPVAAIAPSLSN